MGLFDSKDKETKPDPDKSVEQTVSEDVKADADDHSDERAVQPLGDADTHSNAPTAGSGELTEDDINPDDIDDDSDDDIFRAEEPALSREPLAGATETREELKPPAKLNAPDKRIRSKAPAGHPTYAKQDEVTAHEGEVRYVVRFNRFKSNVIDRVHTHNDPEGLFESKAEAKEVVERLKKQKIRLKNGTVTKLPKYKNIHIEEVELPSRIQTWDKWCQLRIDIRKFVLGRGLALTGGDRTPAVNDQYNGVPNSSHLTTRKDRFADDYAGGTNYALLREVAEEVKERFGKRGRLEVLVHDAGSGTHLHIGGPTDGNN